MYRKTTPQIVKALRETVGPDDVFYGPHDAERLAPYAHDETVGLRAEPEVAVRVTSASQVSRILRLAQRERVPVTPRGAGYGLSGGAVATQGGLVLSTERMNRILEIDEDNLMVVVEPGVITGEHGIGATRRRYLPLALDEAQIEVMRRIRDAFDPNHILNPGKIFP